MSTPEQLKGSSRRRQIQYAEAYAKEKGLELEHEFRDLGVSAFRGRNAEIGALSRFKSLVEEGEVERGSYLIVESMDRLSRDNVMRALDELRGIVNRGIVVVTLDDRQEYTRDNLDRNYQSLIIALGAMSRANSESVRKSGLIRDAWADKKRLARTNGKILTRQMPAWLEWDRQLNAIVEKPERAVIVREIFELVRDGYGAYSISRVLNARGEVPWSTRKHAVWRESYVKKILASRAVLGEYHPHRVLYDDDNRRRREPDGDPIVGYYPAVISAQLFDEAHASMARRRVSGRGRKGKAYGNLFTGILRCACGAGYRYIDKGAAPKGGQYLQCSVSFAKGKCGRRALGYQQVEETLLSFIESLDIVRILGGEAKRRRIALAQHDLASKREDQSHVESKMRRVLTAIETENAIPPLALRGELRSLEDQLTSLKTQIHSLEREIGEIAHADPERHRRVIDDLLQKMRGDGPEHDVERIRRALAAEIQRMIEYIEIDPQNTPPFELKEANEDWKETFNVRSDAELQKLLRHSDFSVRIKYWSGEHHFADALSGVFLKLRGSRNLSRLHFLADAPDAVAKV